MYGRNDGEIGIFKGRWKDTMRQWWKMRRDEMMGTGEVECWKDTIE